MTHGITVWGEGSYGIMDAIDTTLHGGKTHTQDQ